jgi:hypothetical protein
VVTTACWIDVLNAEDLRGYTEIVTAEIEWVEIVSRVKRERWDREIIKVHTPLGLSGRKEVIEVEVKVININVVIVVLRRHRRQNDIVDVSENVKLH